MNPSESAVEDRCDAARFRSIVIDAAASLARQSTLLDALNVFPVPDGDTGSNMVLTMRAAMAALTETEQVSIAEVAAALARGALMGAHGNSGVILSQYWRGLARGLHGHDSADGAVFARALAEASSAAWSAVDRPVEGTILTVARDVARVAIESAERGATLDDVLVRSAQEARASVERTRGLLPALRQADVVDSGALGLAAILEGMSLSWRGEPLPSEEVLVPPHPAAVDVPPETYGFCTEFVIRGEELDPLAIRSRLRMLGDSVLAVGDSATVRVHLHTFRPGDAVGYASGLGIVEQVKIDDMQEQNRRLRGCDHGQVATTISALLVIADGDGFARLFRSLGAAAVLSDATTVDVLAADVSRAMRENSADQYVLMAEQASLLEQIRETLTSTEWADWPVVTLDTRDLARGVAAALAFQPERSAKENVRAMTRALVDVRVGCIAAADFSPPTDGGLPPTNGIVGTIDGQVVATGSNVVEVAVDLLQQLGASESEVVTLYVGRAIAGTACDDLAARIRGIFSAQQVDLIDGGQAQCFLYLACE